jgi:Carboxypeptidase regulatory-like domain
MNMVDSPDPDYLQKGGPSEKKAHWLKRNGARLALIVLNVALAGAVVFLLVTRPDLLQAYGGLSGQVVNAEGSPLSNAQVFISSAERWVTVDANGRFAVDRLPAGQTLILVVLQSENNSVGGPLLSQAVTIPADQTAELGALVLADTP